jgi:hypothetical protein
MINLKSLAFGIENGEYYSDVFYMSTFYHFVFYHFTNDFIL